jgi:hypothetical protein
MSYGLCEAWPARWCCDISDKNAGEVDQARQAASEILDALSGRQFSTGCEVTLRPCRRDCAEAPWGWVEWPGVGWPQAALIGGLWFNLMCGTCPGTCSCSRLSEALLPAPVNTITSVKVDGSPLATGSYRVDDARVLVRLDGEEWPRCQDFTLADTQAGTWSVTATYGQDVPVLGELAVGELACEILRACAGEDCRLPANVTQLVRQGVTIQMPDPNELLKEGSLGLRLVDLFIKTYNAHGLPARSRVYSVDRPPARRVST